METMVIRMTDGSFRDVEAVGHIPDGPSNKKRIVVTDDEGKSFAAELWPNGWQVITTPIILYS